MAIKSKLSKLYPLLANVEFEDVCLRKKKRLTAWFAKPMFLVFGQLTLGFHQNKKD